MVGMELKIVQQLIQNRYRKKHCNAFYHYLTAHKINKNQIFCETKFQNNLKMFLTKYEKEVVGYTFVTMLGRAGDGLQQC